MRLLSFFSLTFLLSASLVLGVSLLCFPTWPAACYAGFFSPAKGLSMLLVFSLLVILAMLYTALRFHYQRYKPELSGFWRFLGWDLLWTWLSVQLLWLMLLPIFMTGYARYGVMILGGEA